MDAGGQPDPLPPPEGGGWHGWGWAAGPGLGGRGHDLRVVDQNRRRAMSSTREERSKCQWGRLRKGMLGIGPSRKQRAAAPWAARTRSKGVREQAARASYQKSERRTRETRDQSAARTRVRA